MYKIVITKKSDLNPKAEVFKPEAIDILENYEEMWIERNKELFSLLNK